MNDACKVLIIEDEFLIALNLKETLTKEAFDVIGTASSYTESIQICKSRIPDIALVDINIEGDKNGIETAAFLKEAFGVAIIFLTAYNSDEVFELAKKVNPAAFLTKPFESQEVVRAVQLLAQKRSLPTINISLKQDGNLILNTGDGWHKVAVQDIIYIASDNNYCTFYLKSGMQVLVHKSLKSFEEELSNAKFYRCHQSYLINLNALQKIEKKEGFRALLLGGTSVPIARNRRPELLEIFLN